MDCHISSISKEYNSIEGTGIVEISEKKFLWLAMSLLLLFGRNRSNIIQYLCYLQSTNINNKDQRYMNTALEILISLNSCDKRPIVRISSHSF